ncbi:unnamed protein product [Plutella xylostella]|uniref:(diamondback moth) hypothetical protein n=1 Tax=Plutella xylostella TaxID=51655 RepID=A0A8S4GEP1_PLUXY|nr:unnamed protein product [Plutella xylostella]
MAQAAPRTHSFAKKTFHKPTYCHHCSDLLWGLIGQGYGCEGTRMRGARVDTGAARATTTLCNPGAWRTTSLHAPPRAPHAPRAAAAACTRPLQLTICVLFTLQISSYT